MNIQAIRLRNFRGFSNVTLPLKPLTVLLGPNSSGKSSFGHALAATAHCQRRDGGSQRPSLTARGDSDEWPVDLGTTGDLRTHGETGRVYVGFGTQQDWVDLGFGEVEFQPNALALSYISHPFTAQSSQTQQTELPANNEGGAASKSEVIPLTGIKIPDVEDSNIALRRVNESTWWDETKNKQATVDLDGLLVSSMKHSGGTPYAPRMETRETINFLFKTLTYLRANRKRPSRSYADQVSEWQPIGYAGEWTAAVLRAHALDSISFFQPPEFPQGINSGVPSQRKQWSEWSGSLSEGVALWLQQIALATSVQSIHDPNDRRRVQVRVSLPGQQPRDITEVGFGVSQVLPVLTAGLMQPEGSLFVVDLPEAHLHPLPQARLADFFCSLVLSGRNALVETHSEMFFHWLRLRAEMDDRLRDNIAVYFIDRPRKGLCEIPKLIELTGNAQLNWPVGFFEEAWNIESHIKTVRDAKAARQA